MWFYSSNSIMINSRLFFHLKIAIYIWQPGFPNLFISNWDLVCHLKVLIIILLFFCHQLETYVRACNCVLSSNRRSAQSYKILKCYAQTFNLHSSSIKKKVFKASHIERKAKYQGMKRCLHTNSRLYFFKA